jgi:hypothetical protein
MKLLRKIPWIFSYGTGVTVFQLFKSHSGSESDQIVALDEIVSAAEKQDYGRLSFHFLMNLFVFIGAMGRYLASVLMYDEMTFRAVHILIIVFFSLISYPSIYNKIINERDSYLQLITALAGGATIETLGEIGIFLT